MRKWITVLFCFITYYSPAQIKAGITAAYNNAELYTHKAPLTGDYTRKTSSLSFFYAGAFINIRLHKNFILQPEILISEKGTHKIEGGGYSGIYTNSNIRLTYLEVPANILYSIYTHKNLKVFAGAGLYAAMGLWGREKGSYKNFDSTGMPVTQFINNKVDFTNSEAYKQNTINIKSFDAGYNIITGVEIKNAELKASYSYGFNKVYMNEYRNLVFSFSLSYFLSAFKQDHFQ